MEKSISACFESDLLVKTSKICIFLKIRFFDFWPLGQVFHVISLPKHEETPSGGKNQWENRFPHFSEPIARINEA